MLNIESANTNGVCGPSLEMKLLLQTLATAANQNDLSQDLVIESIFKLRYADGKNSGWSDERIATSMDMCVRNLQLKKKDAQGFDYASSLVAHVDARNGRDAVALIIDLTKGNEVTLDEIATSLKFAPEKAIPIIRRATNDGYIIETRRSDGRTVYGATDKPYVYAKALGLEDRRARSERSLWIGHHATSDSIFQRVVHLTDAGQAHLRLLFDPKHQPCPQLAAVVRREEEAKVRTGGKVRFGVTLNLAPEAPRKGEGSQVFLLRKTHDYVDVRIDVITSGGQFDGPAVKEFVSEDVPMLVQHFQNEIDIAQAMGAPDDARTVFTFSMAYGPVDGDSSSAAKTRKVGTNRERKQTMNKASKRNGKAAKISAVIWIFMFVAATVWGGASRSTQRVAWADHGCRHGPGTRLGWADHGGCQTGSPFLAMADHGSSALAMADHGSGALAMADHGSGALAMADHGSGAWAWADHGGVATGELMFAWADHGCRQSSTSPRHAFADADHGRRLVLA